MFSIATGMQMDLTAARSTTRIIAKKDLNAVLMESRRPFSCLSIFLASLAIVLVNNVLPVISV